MAYWWVSQNQTYRHERGGGFLWAPTKNEDGITFFHWATMGDVQPGDVILSYVGGRIVAVSVAKTAAYDSPRPGGMGDDLWQDAGRRIDVEYRDLPNPISITEITSELQLLLPDRYSPLNRNGTGNQGYLFALPARAARLLLDRLDEKSPTTAEEIIEVGLECSVPETTQRRALTLSRIGQGVFRDRLIELWGGRCAVTGLDLVPLLRASHIKPWRDSDNRERLDRYNGLLLSPNIDAAFDAGYLSFLDDGRLVLSPALDEGRQQGLGIDAGSRITGLHDRHRAFLDHHRRHVLVVGVRQ